MKNAKTNEQLAIEAKTGDPDAVEQLWLQVRSFAASKAHEFIREYSIDGRSVCGATVDDLIQEAFISMLKAVEKFDPAAKCGFLTFWYYFIQTGRAELCGYRTSKEHPLDHVVSLDTPIGDAENEGTLGDVVEDPNGENGLREVESEMLYSQLCDVMVELLRQLPDQQRKVLTMHYLQGIPYMQICDALDMKYHTLRTTESKAMRNLRAPKNAKRLQEIETELDDLTDFYRTGCHDFLEAGERVIEKHVIRRDRIRKQKMRDCP